MTGFIGKDLYKKIVHSIPICTVDIIFFRKEDSKILLGKRCNPPIKGQFYSIGGRLQKNERLSDAAYRISKSELGIIIKENELIFGGVVEEFFSDSIFKGEESHSINIYYFYPLEKNDGFKLDSQHSEVSWHDYSDDSLHPYLKNKTQDLKVLLVNE